MEFDAESATCVIPAQRMKMGEAHAVPLCDHAVEILGLGRQFSGGREFVFEGRPDRPLSNMAMLMAVRRMGFGDIRIHVFQATFKTSADEHTEFDSLVIEACLAVNSSNVVHTGFTESSGTTCGRSLPKRGGNYWGPWVSYAMAAVTSGALSISWKPA